MEASLNSPYGRTALTANVFTIGRSADNQLTLQDPQASSHHAEIRPDAQGYLVTDLGSTNGTFVNEQRLTPRVSRLLASGDVIRIGATRLSYEMAGSDDATVRASSNEYANPGYPPTAFAPQSPSSQSGYPDYQQPPSSPNYAAPAQSGYSGYQQPSSSPNYPAQPGYPDYQQPPAYSNYNANAAPGYPDYQQPPPQPSWAAPAPVPGQFGAPAAPGFQAAPAAQPAKKRRIGLIIGLVILLLLVVGGGIGGYIYLNRSTPEKTLQAFCTALQNKDAQGIFNLESSRLQQQTTLQALQLSLQSLNTPAGGNGIKSCTVVGVTNNNGTTATGTITITTGDGKSSTGSNPLVFENGSWKIDTNHP